MTEKTVVNPHYEQIGGEAGVWRLVERFYSLMDTLPEARTIRNMHARDLSGAKTKLFRFLSGWLGGPALYVKPGQSPRLGHKHAPFPIGPEERTQWLMCMQRALAELELDTKLQQDLLLSFTRLANSLVNQGNALQGHAGKNLRDQVVWLEYPFKKKTP